jgi:hypothetical protein
VIDQRRAAQLLAARRERLAAGRAADALCDEWYPTQRAAWDDPAQLVCWQGGRRIGKTRAGVRAFVRDLLRIPGGRQLYINSTSAEAERIAWWGNRSDGFEPLLNQLGLVENGRVKLDRGDLTISCPELDSWIYLRGADDEPKLRRALGGAYHRVWWDEAQKIPSKLAPSIQEVFMPALLDFRGKFTMTGTAVRQMAGLFYEASRPDLERRAPGWSVHHSNLLENPYWGRAKGRYVVWGARDEMVSGPHTPGEMPAAVAGARWKMGMESLQALLGGPMVAPMDAPMMQREGFGQWVREDAAFVYHVHKVPQGSLFYAPPRYREDGFPDILRALGDLPWDWREGLFALGADLGYYPDPFAFVLWGWHAHDKRLYEVASWKKTHLDANQQAAVLHAVRAIVALAITVVDAGGPAKGTAVGWSKEWVERYQLPIVEAEKQHKHTAIEMVNGDIVTGGIALRDGGVLYEEMAQLQWLTKIVDARGKMVEDPTMQNHACDGGLYGHRHSYQYRWRPDSKPPEPGSLTAHLREEQMLEDSTFDPDEDFS